MRAIRTLGRGGCLIGFLWLLLLVTGFALIVTWASLQMPRSHVTPPSSVIADEQEIRALVDEFARTITRKDVQGNLNLFHQPGGTVDFWKLMKFLPPMQILNADNTPAQWADQLQSQFDLFVTNHMTMSQHRVVFLTSTTANVTAIGYYTYTFDQGPMPLVHLPSTVGSFTASFLVSKLANVWKFTTAVTLPNATVIIVSTASSGVEPPGPILVRRTHRTITTDFDSWNLLLDQINNYVANGNIQQAVFVCSTSRYQYLATLFDPYVSNSTSFCNTNTHVTYIDTTTVCVNGAYIDASCFPSSNGTTPVPSTAIETVNMISPEPLQRDFTITGGPGIIVAGSIFGIQLSSNAILQMSFNVPPEFTAPPGFAVGPIVNVAFGKANQVAHAVWIGPNAGGPAQPTFRLLTNTDLPTIPLSAPYVSGILPLALGGTGSNAAPLIGCTPMISSCDGTKIIEGPPLGTGQFLVGSLFGPIAGSIVPGDASVTIVWDGLNFVITHVATPVGNITFIDGNGITITTIGPDTFQVDLSGTCTSPIDVSCLPTSLTVDTLNVNGTTSLGTFTTCDAPLSPSCLDISSQTCAGGALSSNCIPSDLILDSLVVTNLVILNGTSNVDLLNTTVLEVGFLILEHSMTCPLNGAIIDGNCFAIDGKTCGMAPLDPSCIPLRVASINGISPTIGVGDFTLSAGTGISITPIVNGVSIANTGVTSVGLGLPLSVFSIITSPVTTTGTLTAVLISQPASTFFAGPSFAFGVPTFRTLTANDFAALNLLDGELLVGVTGGAPVPTTLIGIDGIIIDTSNSGNITWSMYLDVPTSIFDSVGNVITLVNQTQRTVFAAPPSMNGEPSFQLLQLEHLPALPSPLTLYVGDGSGTPVIATFTEGNRMNIVLTPMNELVFSVINNVLVPPADIFVDTSMSGNYSFAAIPQQANYVWAGPVFGGPADPVFRPLASEDIPPIQLSLNDTNGGVTGVLPVSSGGTNNDGSTFTGNRIIFTNSIANELVEGTLITAGNGIVSNIDLNNMLTIDLGGSCSSAIDSSCIPSYLALSTLSVNGSTTLGSSTSCAGAMDSSCVDISLETCAGGPIDSNCIPANLVLDSLIVTNLLILNGTTTQELLNITVLDVNYMILENSMTCAPPGGQIESSCFAIDGKSCPNMSLDPSCIPDDLSLNDITLTGMMQCTGGPIDSSCVAAVTSVDLALPVSVFSISGNPVTTMGTLTGTFISQLQNYVFAGPATGGSGIPTFRAFAYGDFPSTTLNYVLVGTGTGVTSAAVNFGLTAPGEFIVTGSPITSLTGGSSFTLTKATQFANRFWAGPTTGAAAQPMFRTIVREDFTGLTMTDGQLIIGSTGMAPVISTLTAGTNINIVNGAGSITISAAAAVTSVGLALPVSVFSISGSPVISTGTLTGTFISQTESTFFAGPSMGSGTPTFRLMVPADLPTMGNGQLYIGVSGGDPITNTLTAGTGISITTGPGTITVTSTADPTTSNNPAGLTCVTDEMLSLDYDSNSKMFRTFTTNWYTTLTLSASVMGSNFGVDTVERALGVSVLNTGAAGANAMASIIQYDPVSAVDQLVAGFAKLSFLARLTLSNLPGGNYDAYIGFMDNGHVTGTPTDGLFFKLRNAQFVSNWGFITRAAGVETATDTGVALTTSVFQLLEIQVNAAGTSATAYIDGVLVATHTTNIPTGSNYFGYGFKIEKTSGGATRAMYIDYARMCIEFTGTR